jgi:hypothetical protein
VNPTRVVFSFFSPNATSPSTDAATLCRTSFPWNQNNLAVSTLSFSNVLSRHLPLELKPKHWNRTTAASHPPQTAWFQPSIAIKKDDFNLDQSLRTQLRLYFTSYLARAPCYRNYTCCHRSLSPPSHTHIFSAQWHSRWWTSQPSSTYWITY